MEKANKYPIIRAYNVLLACSKCGSDMQPDYPPFESMYGRALFKYVCPNCGCKESSGTSYPYQILEFDRAQKEVINVPEKGDDSDVV